MCASDASLGAPLADNDFGPAFVQVDCLYSPRFLRCVLVRQMKTGSMGRFKVASDAHAKAQTTKLMAVSLAVCRKGRRSLEAIFLLL